MRARITDSGLAAVEDRNSRRERMRAWRGRIDPQARQLERELKTLDSRIEVDFIDPETAKLPPSERAPGVIPARWHIILRTGPGKDDQFFPILGDGGAYRDPDSAIVEDMKRRDMWRAGVFDDIMRAEEKAAAARARQMLTESEARVEQFASSYRAAKRVPGDGVEHRRNDPKRKPVAGPTVTPPISCLVLPAGAQT